jgi:RNA polymerase sigma-70 factor, ECF subfamily
VATDLSGGRGPEGLIAGGSREEGFESIFGCYYGAILRFFVRCGFKQEECEELTQETFLRVYNAMDTFRCDSEVKTWLFTIATNLYRNEIRSRRTIKRTAALVSLETAIEQGQPLFGERSPLSGASGMDGPLDALLFDEQVRLLRRELEGLPERMRQCVTLFLNQGLKYREIAVVMQISVETVKAQIFQAKKRLREALGEVFSGLDL